MTIATAIILNAVLALGLLGALALVMCAGYRAARPEGSRTRRRSEPLEAKAVSLTAPEPEFERAA